MASDHALHDDPSEPPPAGRGEVADHPISEVLHLLSDPTLGSLDVAAFLVGVATGRSSEVVDRALAEVLVSSRSPVDFRTRVMVVLGIVAEREARATGGLPAHPLAAQLGPAWSLIGHLVGSDLVVDPAARALFLLGVAVERTGAPLETVLAHLGDHDWQMSTGEKALVLFLGAALHPPLAIDAGTFLGRSAAALSVFCDRVTSIDWGPERGVHVADLPRVDFRCGTAADVVAEVLAVHPEVNLVVLDADHGEEGIVAEVMAVVRSATRGLRAVVIHDSAMATCQRGLASIAWDDEPAVRGVSLDFLPGSPNEEGEVGGGIALLWVASDDPTVHRTP